MYCCWHFLEINPKGLGNHIVFGTMAASFKALPPPPPPHLLRPTSCKQLCTLWKKKKKSGETCLTIIGFLSFNISVGLLLLGNVIEVTRESCVCAHHIAVAVSSSFLFRYSFVASIFF